MNIKTRRVFESEQLAARGSPLVTAEELPDGTALARPIYFRDFRNGSYLSIEDAVSIARDLLTAASKVGAKP